MYPLLFTLVILEIPALAISIHTLYRELLSLTLPLIILILNLLTIAAMLLCCYTNPGIIPQNINNYEWHEDLLGLPYINHNMAGDRSYVTVVHSGLSILQKYCVECHIYRPVRAIHCRSCNHCVERYDHHCPWLGVCVGKNNYRFFIGFLVMINLQIVAVVVAGVVVVVEQSRAGVEVGKYVLEIVVGVVAFGFGLGLGKLLWYHLELIGSGMTTNEDLKETYVVIKGKLPMSRCESVRSPFFEQGMRMLRSKDVDMSYDEPQTGYDSTVRTGKKFSTLVTGRDSVLNSLVDGQL